MSRAFVKDDAPDGHMVIPPRPALPPGVLNYVTPRGLGLLRQELTDLEAERARFQKMPRDNADRTRGLAVVKGQIQLLEQRIASARLVEPADQPVDEVRFGATVTLRRDGTERRLTIVGMDEASAEEGRIGFLAPVARRMTGRKVGDSVPMPTPLGDQPFVIESISYA